MTTDKDPVHTLVTAAAVGRTGDVAVSIAKALRDSDAQLSRQNIGRQERETARVALRVAAEKDLSAVLNQELHRVDAALDTRRATWERAEKRGAAESDLQYHRMARHLSALSDPEILGKAQEILSGRSVPAPAELDAIAAAVKSVDGDIFAALRKTATEQDLYQPWRRDPGARALQAEKRAIDSALKDGWAVPMVENGVPAAVSMESLHGDIPNEQ